MLDSFVLPVSEVLAGALRKEIRDLDMEADAAEQHAADLRHQADQLQMKLEQWEDLE